MPCMDEPVVADVDVEGPSGQQDVVSVPEHEHASVKVPPSLNPNVWVPGESVHNMNDVHVTDTDSSCNDDDGMSVHPVQGDSRELVREIEQGQYVTPQISNPFIY